MVALARKCALSLPCGRSALGVGRCSLRKVETNFDFCAFRCISNPPACPEEGLAGLQDRSSRPHRLHRPTPQSVVVEIERLRRHRWTGKEIASETGVLRVVGDAVYVPFVTGQRSTPSSVKARKLHLRSW